MGERVKLWITFLFVVLFGGLFCAIFILNVELPARGSLLATVFPLHGYLAPEGVKWGIMTCAEQPDNDCTFAPVVIMFWGVFFYCLPAVMLVKHIKERHFSYLPQNNELFLRDDQQFDESIEEGKIFYWL